MSSLMQSRAASCVMLAEVPGRPLLPGASENDHAAGHYTALAGTIYRDAELLRD